MLIGATTKLFYRSGRSVPHGSILFWEFLHLPKFGSLASQEGFKKPYCYWLAGGEGVGGEGGEILEI